MERLAWRCRRRKSLLGGVLILAAAAAALAPLAQEPDRLLVAFVGGGRAALEACGCPAASLGGIARLSALVLRARSKARRSLFLDAGGSLVDPELSDTAARLRRARTILQVYQRTSVTALSVGATDLLLGDELLTLQRSAGFPFLSANLRRDGATVFPATSLFDGPGGRVGVTGVLDDRADLQEGFAALDPTVAAGQAVQSLHAQGARLVIVLSELDQQRNRELAETVPGIDFILGIPPDPEDLNPEWVGETALVSSLDRFQYLGLLELQLPKGSIESRRDLTPDLNGGRAPALGMDAFFEVAPPGPRPVRDRKWLQPERELWLVAIPLPVLPSQAEDQAVRELLED